MKNRNKYHINWFDIIRPEILKRDNYKCQLCGLEHKKYYLFIINQKPIKIDKDEHLEAKANKEKTYQVNLQIAHLDQNPSNNNYENLKALCPSCHLNYDRALNNIKRLTNKI